MLAIDDREVIVRARLNLVLPAQHSLDFEHRELDCGILRHLHADGFDMLVTGHAKLRGAQRNPDVVVRVSPTVRTLGVHDTNDRKRNRADQDISTDDRGGIGLEHCRDLGAEDHHPGPGRLVRGREKAAVGDLETVHVRVVRCRTYC